jgi:predicted nucleic acid-binding protein
MIYLDTSVALAQLLAEDTRPPAGLWRESLVSSRLLEYELWVRLNARGLGRSHADAAHDLLGRLAFLELTPPVLERTLEPFPMPVRTLDALHLASMAFLHARGVKLTLASYDSRLSRAASKMGIAVHPLAP